MNEYKVCVMCLNEGIIYHCYVVAMHLKDMSTPHLPNDKQEREA